MRSMRLIGLSILSFLFLSLPALAGPSPGDKITDFAINKLNGLDLFLVSTFLTTSHLFASL